MISTRSGALVIDTVVCLTLAKWETVSGRFGGYLTRAAPAFALADQPAHRFEFTFTPKHGSWLNLVEGFFSKLARSVLRDIRAASKQELKDRIMAAMDYFNQEPVVHTWAYKLDKAA